jgi:hypothetical protein
MQLQSCVEENIFMSSFPDFLFFCGESSSWVIVEEHSSTSPGTFLQEIYKQIWLEKSVKQAYPIRYSVLTQELSTFYIH